MAMTWFSGPRLAGRGMAEDGGVPISFFFKTKNETFDLFTDFLPIRVFGGAAEPTVQHPRTGQIAPPFSAQPDRMIPSPGDG